MPSPRDKRVPVPLCLVPSAAPADAPAGVCILEASNSLCAEPCDAQRTFTQHFLFECDVTDIRQRLRTEFGADHGGRRSRYYHICGEPMDGHDSSRWVRRITTILKARTIPVKVQDTSLFP